MRQFTYCTENYDEKLRKHGTCEVSLWMHENKVISINPCLQNMTPLIYFSFDNRSKRNSMLPAYSFIFFFPFTIKQAGSLNNLIVSPEQAHVALRSTQKMPFPQGTQTQPSPKLCL